MRLKPIFIALSVLFCAAATAQSSPAEVVIPDYSAHIRTPAPSAKPRINSAKIFGVRPGAELLYTVAATGERPMSFSAENLPLGVAFDSRRGQLSGSIAQRGEYIVTLKATNGKGSYSCNLKIVVGDDIALTPPMGWNSWNCWGPTVSQEKVLSSANALVEKGLRDYGWTYINIDDGWQGKRGGKYNAVQPNGKFSDMKALADRLHDMGLKLGVYSGPWVSTYAGHAGTHSDNAEGTYPWIEEGWCNEDTRMTVEGDPKRFIRRRHWRHGEYSWAEADARQWAEWGVDYLKYDWKPNDVYYTREMSEALRKCGRDIVYSISNTAPFADAYHFKELTQCWRTTGDIRDTWQSISSIGFEQQERWAAFHGPGHWGDADMLVVGMVGGWGSNPHFSRLTPDEQYTHITLWAMLASPMLIGCDLAKLDDFTRNLLCNYEVNDILQDPLGMRGMPFTRDSQHAVYVKILENGDLAVALFNTSDKTLEIEVEPRSLGLWESAAMVRDVWRQRVTTLVYPGDTFSVQVAPHGAELFRLSPGNSQQRVMTPTHYFPRKIVSPRIVE
ncbi:MAG: putative Ig domain-containing protein [Alistipes sp.]|nr:putative Ig domain-containing protein [Alistipes sp.]